MEESLAKHQIEIRRDIHDLTIALSRANGMLIGLLVGITTTLISSDSPSRLLSMLLVFSFVTLICIHIFRVRIKVKSKELE